MTVWQIDLRQWDELGFHGCKLGQSCWRLGTGIGVEVEKVMDVRHEVKMAPWNAEVGRRKNCLLPPPDKSLFVQVSKEPGTVLSLHRYITSDWPRTTYVYLLWTRTLVEKSTMAFLRIKK